MIEKIKIQVKELLNEDNSGHGMEHINRVLELSLKFAEKEKADKDIVSLIALLHDVDDYKLFGSYSEENLSNAKRIMNKVKIDDDLQFKVLSELDRIGYSNLLKGKRPKTLEGKIVSDADMCDTLGANGILRIHKYTLKHAKPFFDKNVFPIEDMTAEKYTRKCADSSVCHLFEKTLKLKKLMFTEAGLKEASKRHQMMVDFLYQLFDEEDADDWKEYLDKYLKKEYEE